MVNFIHLQINIGIQQLVGYFLHCVLLTLWDWFL